MTKGTAIILPIWLNCLNRLAKEISPFKGTKLALFDGEDIVEYTGEEWVEIKEKPKC